MRTLAALAFFGALTCYGQRSAHADSLDVRAITARLNDASVEMRKAAWCRNTSVWYGAFGSAFTMLAADRSVKAYDHKLAVGLGLLTVSGFATLQLVGSAHDKRASLRLVGIAKR